jgi:hypothetical protein
MSQSLPISPAQISAPGAEVRQQSPARTRERVDYIEYFRAVAIIMIVFSHAFDLAWTREINEHVPVSEEWLGFISALFNGGTFYFVFISGFLYRHVFFERVPFGDFMRKKALYVALPYLLIGSALTFMQMWATDFHVTIFKHGAVLGENVFVDYITQMSTGAMMTAYWYVPFIMLVFLASPLVDRFIRLPLAWRVGVFAVSLVIAFWIHRPYENLDPVHAVIYFAKIYLFGILFSEQRQRWLPILTKPAVMILLAIVVCGVALTQDLVTHNAGNIERMPGDGWWPKGFDLIIVQRYAGILLICGVLARWGDYFGRFFGFAAENSFGVYFMHGIVLTALNHVPSAFSPHLGASMADFFTYGLIALLLSFAIVLVIKQVTGRYSRYVIGS